MEIIIEILVALFIICWTLYLGFGLSTKFRKNEFWSVVVLLTIWIVVILSVNISCIPIIIWTIAKLGITAWFLCEEYH